jgi:hypothetical protein
MSTGCKQGLRVSAAALVRPPSVDARWRPQSVVVQMIGLQQSRRQPHVQTQTQVCSLPVCSPPAKYGALILDDASVWPDHASVWLRLQISCICAQVVRLLGSQPFCASQSSRRCNGCVLKLIAGFYRVGTRRSLLPKGIADSQTAVCHTRPSTDLTNSAFAPATGSHQRILGCGRLVVRRNKPNAL